MTTPEEREKARAEADAALEHARQVADRGIKIGARWRRSQNENNFRQMLRTLGQRAAGNA